MGVLANVETKFNERQLQLITEKLAPGATQAELDLFLMECERTQLDPFARQIYSIGRWDSRQKREVRTTQISIDGMRLIAERSGKYRGQTQVMWCDNNGKWFDVWLGDNAPAAAKVGVHHADFAEPLYAVATYKTYAQRDKNQNPNFMWKTKPDIMIAKCAESLALRKAFPHDLSGLYTTEEMQQADNEAVVDVEVVEAAFAPATVEVIPESPIEPQEDAIGLNRAETFIANCLKLFGADSLPKITSHTSQFFNLSIDALEPHTIATCNFETLQTLMEYLKDQIYLTKQAASGLHKQIGAANPYDPSKYASDKAWVTHLVFGDDFDGDEIDSFTSLTYAQRQTILDYIKNES